MSQKKSEENSINYDEKKKEAEKLKEEANRLNEEKERLFSEKEKYSKTIRDNIQQIKELKNKRDELTSSVQENKKKRSEIDEKINKILEDLKKFKAERDKVYEKHNLSGNPDTIQGQINKLEKKIETEVMSFDNEKKLMKKIKSLKSQLDDFGVVTGINDKIKEKNKELKVLRKENRDLTKKIKDEAALSQVQHNKMLEKSKEIDELKPKEEEYFNKFSEVKNKFNDINNQLKELYTTLNIAKGEVKKKKEKAKQEKEIIDKKKLEDKHEEVESKIKKGGKLTTEDLLAFQGISK